MNTKIMKSVALSLLSIAAVGQGRGQSVDSLPDVEINEVKVLSARVPLTSAQTPQQVTIIGREEIAMLPVNTIDDLLKFAVGVDVRQRGNGVQTDICVRGGTFDQVTILLNGINITLQQYSIFCHNAAAAQVLLQQVDATGHLLYLFFQQ